MWLTFSLLLITFIQTSFCLNTSRQARDIPCPTLYVSCPDALESDKPASFSATVTAVDPKVKLVYKWSVSSGKIIEGQGTDSIKVDLSGYNREGLTATVEVEGFGPGCVNKASCSSAMTINCRLFRMFDQYGNIAFKDEKARLDNFALQLQDAYAGQGYIIAYGGRRARSGEAETRARRAQSYLIRKHKLVANQIVIVDGGFREDLTVELYIVPYGTQAPMPTPTISMKEVELIP